MLLLNPPTQPPYSRGVLKAPEECLLINYCRITWRIDPFATLVPKCQYSDRSICNIGTQITKNQYIYIYIYIFAEPCSGRVRSSAIQLHLKSNKTQTEHQFEVKIEQETNTTTVELKQQLCNCLRFC